MNPQQNQNPYLSAAPTTPKEAASNNIAESSQQTTGSFQPAQQIPNQSNGVFAPYQNPTTSSTANNNYDFIINPAKPSKKKLIPNNSLLSRVLIILVGLTILVFAIIIVKGILSPPPFQFQAMLTVAQDQQEITHILTNTASNGAALQSLSSRTQNYIATAQLVVPDEQTSLITYLSNNGYKLSATQLNQTISNTIDSQITASISNGDYDQTLITIMQQQLKKYIYDISVDYKQTKGPIGRSLLLKDYNGAKLMLQMIS